MSGRRGRSRLLILVGDDPIAFRDSFIALVMAALASLVAGLTLAAGTDTLEELPGCSCSCPPPLP